MLTEPIRAIFATNLGVKRGEKVLVFTDRVSSGEVLDERERTRRERLRDIAVLTAEIGKAFSKKITYHEFPSVQCHGTEPPEELWRLAFSERAVDELKKTGLLGRLLSKEIGKKEMETVTSIVEKYKASTVNVVVGLSNYSTTHTRFRDLLTGICGCRYASMPLFDASMLEGAMSVDWNVIEKRTKRIARIVNRAESMEVKTANGTILSFSKTGRKAFADTGILTRPGAFGNLPAGEVYLAPLEGTAAGRLVLDWAPTRELASPVTLVVEKGMVVKIEGDESYSETLRDKCGERQENRNIAELGIGTNERAQRPDNILESEKILGSIHVALGDNSSFGGKVMTPFHQDFVFFRPTVMLIHNDGTLRTLMEDGHFKGVVMQEWKVM
jgi:aminopeptidase